MDNKWRRRESPSRPYLRLRNRSNPARSENRLSPAPLGQRQLRVERSPSRASPIPTTPRHPPGSAQPRPTRQRHRERHRNSLSLRHPLRAPTRNSLLPTRRTRPRTGNLGSRVEPRLPPLRGLSRTYLRTHPTPCCSSTTDTPRRLPTALSSVTRKPPPGTSSPTHPLRPTAELRPAQPRHRSDRRATHPHTT